MSSKLRNWFLIYIFVISSRILTTPISYAIQGQLNYDIGSPQGVITVEEQCTSQLDIANQTNRGLKTQKDNCIQANTLLKKTMEETVDKITNQKNIFTILFIISTIVACVFFLISLILLKKLKTNKINTPPRSPQPPSQTFV